MSTFLSVLAQVEVPNSPTTIYTVPALTETDAKEINLRNTSVSPITIEIWVNGSSNVNSIIKVTLSAGDFAILDHTITLEAGDTIVAEASAASSITMTIFGLEFT